MTTLSSEPRREALLTSGRRVTEGHATALWSETDLTLRAPMRQHGRLLVISKRHGTLFDLTERKRRRFRGGRRWR